MPTHPLWRPFELTDLEVDVVVTPLPASQVVVTPYDDAWPVAYVQVESLVRDALGDLVLAIEHTGSTSVPGLAAKAVVDAVVTVPDPADEAAYVPPLQVRGYVLRVREPDWEEHRMLTTPERAVNLHVFGPGAVEPRRQVLFRDWLRGHAEDRDAYGAHKTEIAARGFDRVMAYNNEKAALVYDIYEKALAADPAHEHDPQPRG